ncbi:unnamed protein product, partial [Phaeothamnion confervicola]
YLKYFQTFEQNIFSEEDYGVIFTPEGCKYAMELILNSRLDPDDEKDYSPDVMEAIFKFILAVNQSLFSIAEEQFMTVNGTIDWEIFNAVTLSLSEHRVEINPMLNFGRAYHHALYLAKSAKYGSQFKEYIYENYRLNPFQYIFIIYYIYNANRHPDHRLRYLYEIDEPQKENFDKFSERMKSANPLSLLNLKKSPFYKLSECSYLLMDNTTLIAKIYHNLLNDFWFDKLKPIKMEEIRNSVATRKELEGKITNIYQEYKSDFGRYFFEPYVARIFEKMFEKLNKYAKILKLGDLIIRSPAGDIEITDLYLRHSNKIILGEIKSGLIYDKEKYSGNLMDLYRQNRNAFFDNFGINQLVSCIGSLRENIVKVDSSFNNNQRYNIYPCIVVNDTALQTPLMANVFNTRFMELIDVANLAKFNLKPLTLIHVSDMERLEDYVNESPSRFWDLLDRNFADRKFIPPFYTTHEFYVRGIPEPNWVRNLINKMAEIIGVKS